MALSAGQLHIVRKVITLEIGTTDIDTGICQTEVDVASGQPGLGTDPSRVVVIPIGNTGPFLSVSAVGEPFVSPSTGTVHVALTSDTSNSLRLNVLFVDLNTFVGPGRADNYAGTASLGTSPIAGNLLWAKRNIDFVAGANDIDTGIVQTSQAFATTDPKLDASGSTGSRVHVIPLLPCVTYYTNFVSIGEPFVDATTGTVHVVITMNDVAADVNLLFLDMHTILGAGSADTYNP